MKIKTFLIYSKSAVHTVALFHFTQKKINCATVKSKKKKQTKKSFNSRGNCSSNIYLGFLHRRVGWAIAIITELFNSLNFFWSFVWTQVSAFNRRKLLRTGKWHAELTHLSRFRDFAGCLSRHINMNTKSWQSERQKLVIQKIGISLGL